MFRLDYSIGQRGCREQSDRISSVPLWMLFSKAGCKRFELPSPPFRMGLIIVVPKAHAVGREGDPPGLLGVLDVGIAKDHVRAAAMPSPDPGNPRARENAGIANP